MFPPTIGPCRRHREPATPVSRHVRTNSLTTPPPGFTWDENASVRSVDEYGFSFTELVSVFDDDRYGYLDLGEGEHLGEMRRVIIGRLPWGLIVAVVYTMRGDLKRIIWVRPARRSERRAFNEHNRISDAQT